MKYLALTALILTALSCRQEEIQSYNDLDEDEQEALRLRAAARCLNDSLKNFTDFKTTSNEKLNDYDRGDSWQIDYKSGSTSSSTKIYVWKKTATSLYLVHAKKVGLNDTYEFIKINTTVNGQMIDDLRVKKCDMTEKIRTVSNPSETITIKFSKVKSTDNDIKYETDTTYTSDRDYPIFFSDFNVKAVKRKYKSDGQVDSTESEEYKMANLVDRKNDLKAAYSDYPSAYTSYCIMNYTLGTPNSFNFPYSPFNCKKTDATTNVNTGGDAAFDFTPNKDLCLGAAGPDCNWN